MSDAPEFYETDYPYCVDFKQALGVLRGVTTYERYRGLMSEIRQWEEDNNVEWTSWHRDRYKYYFKYEADVISFKLRFGI